MFAKYQRFMLNIKVNIDPNTKWCPKPDCTFFV